MKNSCVLYTLRHALKKTQNAKRKTQSGITFIELLVVIIIIGILTSVSIPQFRKTFDNFELEDFIKNIYYLSRYLQASAIGEGKIYYLDINKEEGKFRAKYKEKNELKDIGGRFGKEYETPKAVIISINPPEKTGVYFYPDGSIDKINITLENQHKKRISLDIKGAAGAIQVK